MRFGALRHLVSILVLPFTVVVIVPAWLLSVRGAPDSRWVGGSLEPFRYALGLLLFAAGFGMFAWCVVLFARVGRGTLAPWDPTRALVAVGPYSYVRNPMISGVAAMLAGEAVFFGSSRLAGWLLLFVLINHVYFVAVEEPGLRRRFGAGYDEYKRRVPRWMPRRVR